MDKVGQGIKDGFDDLIARQETNERNKYEGLADTKRLDWLEDNEMNLVSNRELSANGEWWIWWRVVKRRKAMSHPYGHVREAIDVAMSRRKD